MPVHSTLKSYKLQSMYYVRTDFNNIGLANIQMNEAAMAALYDKLSSTETSEASCTIKTCHFERALSKISPSVSNKVSFTFNH